MIRTFLIALTLTCLASFSYAQTPSMRVMAVDQLFQYGRAVYDRADYSEAANIFSRLLQMDPDNAAALGYARALKRKGEYVQIPVKVVPPTPVVVKKPEPNEDLKKDLQETDEAIQKMKTDITHLRSKIDQLQNHSDQGIPLQ